MKGNITFTMIKPCAMQHGYMTKILNEIDKNGFRIIALKMTRMSEEQASLFYEVHKDRPFYDNLVKFMSSGSVVAAVVQKENAVDEFRKLIGATNPAEAAPGSIRKNYGDTVQRNAVHGSDSDENAKRESSLFFQGFEYFS